MQLPKKAAIYSGCIFPGAGYFLVGNRLRAYSCILFSLMLVALIVYDSVQKALTILNNILVSGEIPTHISALIAQINSTPGAFSTDIHTTLTILLAVIWLLSILDCYRLGKKLNNNR